MITIDRPVREVRTAAAKVSPYPGLRPFWKDESDYFFGRDLQSLEVVTRLRNTRFVAVIGGSGSGKSSLVLAGAIPRLRTFAIEECGDFWVPIVATPGTNQLRGDSPLRRLARKFCGELTDVEDARSRIDTCVELLRNPNGLGELVDRFGKDLKYRDGVDLERPEVRVNFLFLIDQFEELFHPSNLNASVAADCEHLVNRLVEQFRQRHPRICVAMTMRSEHLNDCPRYAGLPEAINAAAYLVKRLDGEQLRKAIEQPALRFLRKRMADDRNARRKARTKDGELRNQQWPDGIPFEPGLVERLLEDSAEVLGQQDHADHLPLLQHLLFWIWAAASKRCEDAPVPDALKLVDLWAAVRPEGCTDIDGPDDSVNTLTACLENRCEAIFAQNPKRQTGWEEVFRSLAFKEPNTGTYTQQRASMAELCNRPNIDLKNVDALREDLSPWLEPHRYLHWDTDSQTVKVAHETLIRRWARFRKWTDEEDIQFQAYVRLLEDCHRWEKASRHDKSLSTGDTLRRFEDAKLPQALRDPELIARFGRLLEIHREGCELSEHAPTALTFLEKSVKSRDSHATAVRKRMARNRLLLGGAGLIIVAGLAIFTVVELLNTAESNLFEKERTLRRGYAIAAETQVTFQPQFKDLDGAQLPLRNTLMGAHFFQEGQKRSVGPADWRVLRNLYINRLDSMQNAALLGEARNIASLWTVLQGSAWKVSQEPAQTMKTMKTRALPCTPTFRDARSVSELRGARFYPRRSGAGRQGLVLSRHEGGTMSLYSARMLDDATCMIGNQLISTPPHENVGIGLAADLSNLVLEFPEPESNYFMFYAILWDETSEVRTRPRATISKALNSAHTLKINDVTLLESARSVFATDMKLGTDTVRLFDVEPTAIAADIADQGSRMNEARHGGICRAVIPDQDITTAAVFELGPQKGQERTYCLQVTSVSGTSEPAVVATLYGSRNTKLSSDKSEHLPLLGGLVLGNAPPVEYRMNTQAGWLAFKNATGQWRAVSWSLDAWRGLAKGVFVPERVHATPAEGRQFSLAYELIIGNERVPHDSALADALPLPPNLTTTQTHTANGGQQ